MKQIFTCLLALALGAMAVRGQDAATEERLNKIAGQIEDLIAGQKALQKHIADLSKELDSVREQLGRPNADYATREDLKRLEKHIEEVDRKRLDDAERTRTELTNIGKNVEAALKARKNLAAEKPAPEKAPAPEGKVFEYTVEKGDTLSLIVQAYRDQNIKVTTEQILKANPGLKPEKLRPGMKIYIPAPKS